MNPGHPTAAPSAAASRALDRLASAVRDRPGRVLAWMLCIHLLVWTIVPILVSPNLQLDLVDLLALGKEWQLGYWKHPSLPWWTAELVYRLTGRVEAVYALGPLAVVVCFYAVYLLAREIAGATQGLIAVAALEAVHYYNFSAVKFAHDQMQLPFWALTGLFTWRAITRGRLTDWALAGAFLAGAFWSKYAAFALAATLGLVLLLDPVARRAWRTPGPYVMGAVFILVIAPNVWWLVAHDFLPFRYVDDRARVATTLLQHGLYPLRWGASQAAFLMVMALMLMLLYLPRRPMMGPADADPLAGFNRRYVGALALGPFAVVTAIAIALGRQPVALWGYPLWSFAPLAVLTVLPPRLEFAQLRRFALAAIAVLIIGPLTFLIAEIGEPYLRERAKASQFAGRLLADTITRQWQERTGTPLTYVGGAIVIDSRGRESRGSGQFAANNVAVYSADRPHVIVNGELKFSPWIDPADLERRGAVLVWQPAGRGGMPDNIKRAFPRAELQPPLRLPRQSSAPGRGDIVEYAIVPPRP